MMTSRSYETIRVGLRRVIRDASASAKIRMHAIERLMYLEGLMDESRNGATPKNRPAIRPISEANAKRFRELIAMEQEKKTG